MFVSFHNDYDDDNDDVDVDIMMKEFMNVEIIQVVESVMHWNFYANLLFGFRFEVLFYLLFIKILIFIFS